MVFSRHDRQNGTRGLRGVAVPVHTPEQLVGDLHFIAAPARDDQAAVPDQITLHASPDREKANAALMCEHLLLSLARTDRPWSSLILAVEAPRQPDQHVAGAVYAIVGLVSS